MHRSSAARHTRSIISKFIRTASLLLLAQFRQCRFVEGILARFQGRNPGFALRYGVGDRAGCFRILRLDFLKLYNDELKICDCAHRITIQCPIKAPAIIYTLYMYDNNTAVAVSNIPCIIRERIDAVPAQQQQRAAGAPGAPHMIILSTTISTPITHKLPLRSGFG